MSLVKMMSAYEQKVPLSLSLSGDHNGLKLGKKEQSVTKVLGCLELTEEVAEYVIRENVDCLFVHHDPFYAPFYALAEEDALASSILELIKHNVALYVSHTNLDIVDGGLNDYLFTLLGGTKGKKLDQQSGIGRYGVLKTLCSLSIYVKTYVAPIQANFRVIAKDQQRQITSIAVVNGSGADFLAKAEEHGVDLFITGDVDYHSAMLARAKDIAVIDIGHDIEYLVHDVFNRIFNEIKQETAAKYQVVSDISFDFSPW